MIVPNGSCHAKSSNVSRNAQDYGTVTSKIDNGFNSHFQRQNISRLKKGLAMFIINLILGSEKTTKAVISFVVRPHKVAGFRPVPSTKHGYGDLTGWKLHFANRCAKAQGVLLPVIEYTTNIKRKAGLNAGWERITDYSVVVVLVVIAFGFKWRACP